MARRTPRSRAGPASPGRVVIAGTEGAVPGVERALGARGWRVTRLEAFRIEGRDLGRHPPWTDPPGAPDVWVVTSRAVVAAFWHRHPGWRAPLRAIPRVWAVGPSTARALRSVGLRPRVPRRPAGAGRLGRALGNVGGLRVLYLRSDRAGPGLARLLRRRGARVIDRVAYRLRPVPPKAARSERARRGVRAWLVTSPSALGGLRRALGASRFRREAARVEAFALGPRTGTALRRAGVERVRVAPTSSEEAFTRLVVKALGDAPSGARRRRSRR